MLQKSDNSKKDISGYWWLIIPIFLFASWLIPVLIIGTILMYATNKPMFDKMMDLLGLSEYVGKIEKEITGAIKEEKETKSEGSFNKETDIENGVSILDKPGMSYEEYYNSYQQETEVVKREEKKVTGTLNRSKNNSKPSIWDDYESVSEVFKRNKR